jgi:hypothetical protein
VLGFAVITAMWTHSAAAENYYFVTTTGSLAGVWIKLTTISSIADRSWYVDPNCTATSADKWIAVTDIGSIADFWVALTPISSLADEVVCLGGDVGEFWKHAQSP